MSDRSSTIQVRDIADLYDEPGVVWALRSLGEHFHPGGEDATVALAAALEAQGLPPGARLVEIASALGGPARYLARRFAATVLCIDADPRMHAAARPGIRTDGLSLRCPQLLARTERLPLAAGSCDAAWSQDAMCHMEKPAVVAEVARVVRPAGLFAFTDWIAVASLTRVERDALAATFAFPAVLRLPEYVALLDTSGFDVLLAEDRTTALLASRRGSPPDQEEWERRFVSRFGVAELERQREPGRVWHALVQAGRAGYGMFVARRRGAA